MTLDHGYSPRPQATFTALFPFCGLGAGALGFLDAEVALLGRRARFRSLGGIDLDQEACTDFEALTGSPALCADVAELTAQELIAFAGARAPDVVFSSPPCKGFSGLLSKKAAKKDRYRKLNRLVLDWIDVMLEAWGDEPPRLVLIENVPRIASRGEAFLRRVRRRLAKAGYVFTSSTHDCGELGGLAQHRRRFLLVARHPRRCPPLLYQPPVRRVRACGEVLGQLPMPEDPAAGELHRLPKISWLNWVRLGLIPAGGDWRDLPGVLEEGQARREVHKRHEVAAWDQPTGTIAGSGSNGVTSVADPRIQCLPRSGTYGVGSWGEPSKTVIGAARIDSGAFAVADPRPAQWHRGILGVRRWGDPSGTVTGRASPMTGTFAVSDPRYRAAYDHALRVLRWDEPSFTVAGKTSPGCGAYQVADPRLPGEGVLPIDAALATLEGGPWSVLNPETGEIVVDIRDPRKAPDVAPVILARDGTWHRPLTTLELAALQGLPARVGGKPLRLAGRAVSRWRERIGNAVPVQTAEAIARRMLVSLVEAEAGAMSLSSLPLWVAPDGAGLSAESES